MIERRTGGEAGIVAVQCLEGEAIWQAASEGKWSTTLAEAALHVVELSSPTSMAGAAGEHPTVLPPLRPAVGKGAALFLIECADGFTASLLHAQGMFVELRSDKIIIALEFVWAPFLSVSHLCHSLIC